MAEFTAPARSTGTGVFTSLSRLRRTGIEQAAAAAEAAGFDTLWVADARGDLSFIETCLAATTNLTVASAVMSIWDLPAADAAAELAPHLRRTLLGVGVSHSPMAGQAAHRPLAAMTGYLDAAAASGIDRSRIILGANGDRMLKLAGRAAGGAVTQLVTAERTAEQRAALGAGGLLATEVKIVLEGDRGTARQIGRANLANYLNLPNYRKNLLAQGFDETDLDGGGSDRLVDALVAGPEPQAVIDRINEHRSAGADQICAHILSAADTAPIDRWGDLASILPRPAPA